MPFGPVALLLVPLAVGIDHSPAAQTRTRHVLRPWCWLFGCVWAVSSFVVTLRQTPAMSPQYDLLGCSASDQVIG